MSGLSIVSRATDDVLGDVIALRYGWRTEEAGETGMSLEEFQRNSRAWIDDHRSSHLGYVARVGARAVGCAWLCVIDRVPGPGKFLRRGAILQSVYVEPTSRDVGVGSGLLRAMLEDALTMGLDYVMVHPSAASFEFYRRAGFTAAERSLELRLDA